MRNQTLSAKTLAGTLGTAVASLFWVLATSLWWSGTFSSEAVVTLTGSTAVLLQFVFSYLTHERPAFLDYARGAQQRQPPPAGRPRSA